MTVRASFRASAVVPPRRLSMARASVRTVIMFRTSLHVYLGLRRPYTFAGLSPHSPEPDRGRDGRAGRSATLFLSRVNMEEHLLRGPRDVGETEDSDEAEVRKVGRRPGQGTRRRPLQRRFGICQLPGERRRRPNPARQERRHLEGADVRIPPLADDPEWLRCRPAAPLAWRLPAGRSGPSGI